MKLNTFLLFFLCICLFAGCSDEETTPSLTIESEKEITLAFEKNSEATIRFTSTQQWQAATTSEWLDVSPTSGKAGTHTLTIKATSNNNSGAARQATITLTSKNLTKELTIEQEIGDYVNTEQDIYQVSPKGGPLEIGFTTNVDDNELVVKGSEANWLTQPKTRAENSYVVKLIASPNPDKQGRTATINFYKTENQELALLKKVTIVQDGTESGTSIDYSADKRVHILQKATAGKGIPIVIMGDGFIDTEIADGTYDKVMEKAMENLFTEEPLTSLRHYFNVYSVTAVSKNNLFAKGYETVFSCELEGEGSTGISGNDEKIMEYVQSVDGIDWMGALTVVILNSPAYAGTTYFGYGYQSKMVEFAIAYCPVINDLESESFRQVLVHEAAGHGFVKLEDEYSYDGNGEMPSSEIKKVQQLQAFGWALNVDFTKDRNNVLWTNFLNDSRYDSEGLGIYEGACTYMTNVYRPSRESMMNNNIMGFNAPSRKAIYDMVMKRGTGKTPDYEDFVAFDQQVPPRLRSVSPTSPSAGKAFARPRFMNKTLTGK